MKVYCAPCFNIGHIEQMYHFHWCSKCFVVTKKYTTTPNQGGGESIHFVTLTQHVKQQSPGLGIYHGSAKMNMMQFLATGVR